MVNSGTFEPPPLAEGGPSEGEQALDDQLRCSVPLEKLDCLLNAHPQEDVSKTRSAASASRKLLCLYCERTFASVNLRQKHVERAHSSRRVPPCAYCDGAGVGVDVEPLEHLVRDHPTKYFGCLPCEERFPTAGSLAEHQAAAHRDAAAKGGAKAKRRPPDEAKGKKTRKMKKRESKRLQAMAKTAEGGKKRAGRKEDGGRHQGLKVEKTKTTVVATNPHPESEGLYRVKKITDHSIDNLKIGSLTFDDVFDKAFFNRIKCNIEENLLHHIDGKLFENEESENRISNFEKVSTTTPEVPTTSDTYGCELSLNAVTPVASLSLASHYGEDFESQIEYGARPAKKRPPTTKPEPVFHYKYFTRRKFQASIQQQKENRDLSKLDMWTQLVIGKRQQRVVDEKKSPKERQEYAAGDEYKSKVRREELDRILDRRGPFEDLKEEASQKAALDNLNSGVSHESFAEVREVLDEVLERVFDSKADRDKLEVEEKVTAKRETDGEPPGHLGLRRVSSLTDGDGDAVDPSDRIALICSAQDTEDYELPTNRARRRDEPVELSGEWARRRLYVCAACGAKLPDMKYLIDHESLYHQHVWVQHYEFVGSQNELYRHLSIPALGKVGLVEDSCQGKGWKRSEARTCSKCDKRCNSLGELHRHILECGGDWSWMMARKKCKYRPCKSRRKRLRGLVHRIRQKEKDEGPTEKKKYKKTLEGPRQRPSDAETIQRMLANLPAKRSTRKLISLYDGVRTARKKNQMQQQQQQQTLTQKKVKCGKVIYKSSNVKENTEKTLNVAQSALKPGQSSNRRSLRNMSRVLSSRILDTNANLNVKRKLKALCEKRSTRQSKLAGRIDPAAPPKEEATTSKAKPDNPKRTSPRSAPKNLKMMNVKKLSTGNVNMKSFFPVKKQKTKGTESADKNVSAKTKIKRKSIESGASAVASEEAETAESDKSKTGAVKKMLRSLSVKKKPVKILTEKDAQPQINEPNHVEEKSDNKRKLKRSFRNVINRVKRLKIDSVAESLQDDTKSTFLGEPLSEHLTSNQSVKIVVPSNSEAKENSADISESAHIATNFTKSTGDSPVPENIFKLGSSDEKSLQAKGDLDFDSQQVADVKRKKTETEIPPLTIEISEKPKVVPLVSPNVKGKIKKPTRGLNDCIAMLTSKLQQKTNEPPVKTCIFNAACSTQPPRILADPSPQKSDCILKIPTFKTQKEPSGLEDAALDLTVKPKNPKAVLEVPTTCCPVANQPYFEPFHFGIPQMTSSVERIINSVIESNFQKSWNAVDETIQCVVDGHPENRSRASNSVDDIIDFVATRGRHKEDNNNRVSLILKQPGDRSQLKAAPRKPSPTKRAKVVEGQTGSLIPLGGHDKAQEATLEPITRLLEPTTEDILVKHSDNLDATIESVVKDSPVGDESIVKKLSLFRRNKDRLKTVPTAPVETHLDDVLVSDNIQRTCENVVVEMSAEPLILENKVVVQIHPSDSEDDVPLAVLVKPLQPQPLLLEASENKVSPDGDITSEVSKPADPDLGDEEARESQIELSPQPIEDLPEAATLEPETKKPPTKKRGLSKKKRAPGNNVVIENEENEIKLQEPQTEIVEDMQSKELAVTTPQSIVEQINDDVQEQTASVPETIPTLVEVEEIQAKDSIVENITADSLVNSLPFANEEVLPEISPVSKRNAVPRKRAKKTKFSRKKTKKKFSVTVSEMLEDISEPTSTLDLKLLDEPLVFQSEIALTTGASTLPETSLEGTAIPPEDVATVETVSVAEVIETKDAEKEEHDFKIPLSDDSVPCDASKAKNVKKKTARSKVKKSQRSRSLKTDSEASSSDEQSHSPVKLRSRSLKKYHTEPEEAEDVLSSEIPTPSVNESASIISETLITLRKELGLPSREAEEEALPKRSARLSGSKPASDVVELRRVVHPPVETLEGGETVFKTPTKKSVAKKSHPLVSIDESDSSNSEDSPVKKSPRTLFNQSTSESEVDEGSFSDGGFKPRTRSSSRSLASDLEVPNSNGLISSFEREVEETKLKKASKRKCKPTKSASDQINHVVFQPRRPLRTQKNHICKELLLDSPKDKEETQVGSEEKLQRSSGLLNKNSENIELIKLKSPRNNGKNETSQSVLLDIPHEVVDKMEEVSEFNSKENLEIVAPHKRNSRSLRKKMTVNYSEMEESNIVQPRMTDEQDKADMKNKPSNVGIFDLEPKIPPNPLPDIVLELSKSENSKEESPLLRTAGSRSCGKNKKNGKRTKLAKQSESSRAVVEDNARLDTPVSETETEPPIKIVINKQKASRKSKSIKKIDGKGANDLFEDFALVIKKKRHPFMSFSPPDAFSKDDRYSLFPPKPLEVQGIADEAVCDRRDEDRAELDVSVEEMDMELDEIPINSSIIENTLTLPLPDEKSMENEYSILFGTPIVEIEPLPEPTANKNESRNNRKSRNSKIKKCSELEFDTSVEDNLGKCSSTEEKSFEESDEKVECPTKVDEPKTLRRTSRKSMEKYAEFDIPVLPHENSLEKSQSIEIIEASMKNTLGVEEAKSVRRKARKSKEKHTDFNMVENGKLVENQLEAIGRVPLDVENSKTLTRNSKKSMEEYPEFDIPPLSHVENTSEKCSIREADAEGKIKSRLEAENPKRLKRKVKGKSMEEYLEFDISEFSQVENTLENSLMREAEVENLKTLKKDSRKVKEKSMEGCAKFDIPNSSVENRLQKVPVLEHETVKKNSRKSGGNCSQEQAECDIPALSHVENALENSLIREAEVENLKTLKKNSRKVKEKSMEEFAKFDIPASSVENRLQKVPVLEPETVEKNSRKAGGNCSQEHAEFELPALSHAENGLVKNVLVERNARKAKEKYSVENAECDTPVSPPLIENSEEKSLIEGDLDVIGKSPIQNVEPVMARKANSTFVDFADEFNSPALQYIESAIENIILVEESFNALGKNPVEAVKQKEVSKNVKEIPKEVYAESKLSYMKTDISKENESNSIVKILTEVEESKPSQRKSKEKCMENKPHSKEPSENHLPTVLDIDAITEKTKSLKEVIKKTRGKPIDVKSSIDHLDEVVTDATEMLPINSSDKLSNEPKYNDNKDKDIDLIYAFSETEDVEINTPIELPRRLPRSLDKSVATVEEHDQKAKKKPRLKKISASENEGEKSIAVREIKENGVDLEDIGRRKPMRSAKVKALENIHDDALAELTESERNRELKSLKATQTDGEANRRNRKSKKSPTVPQANENASFSYEALAEDEAPLLAELVAELHGLEELENSIERELNAEMSDKTLNTTDDILEEPTPAEPLPNVAAESASEENQELRRSRRGSRKVASYNENDLIDPITDALESKRNTKKKDTKVLKSKEPDKKLNSDQLFDLLKASTSTESTTYVPKLQNSFLNNLVEVSSEVNAEKFDTDKIYDFNESSVTTERGASKSLLVSKQSDESSSSSSSYKLLTPDIQDSSTSEETEPKPTAANYCEICSKSFIRIENLVKHRRTLTHIQKLSEIEAKEAELKLHQEPTVQEVPAEFSSTHALKLADIISDVLNKPVLAEEASKFPDIVLQSASDPEIKRYKSLGERKSFESDPPTFESKTTILEKQISLLEDIIENNAGYNDDISVSSEDSALKPPAFQARERVDSFLKPTQYEEISEDSANLRPYDDAKLRKTLNRDEELFLECCSLLKSGSEVSSSYSAKRMAHKEVRQPERVAEKKESVQKPELAFDEDYSDENARVPTPLGDSFDDDASNSNTISSSWGVNEKEVCVKEDGTTRLNFQGISAEKRESCQLKFQDLSEKERSPLTSDLPTKSIASEVDSKKIITKGARKVFEGLKVSIPTEELNLEEVLNCSPKLRQPDSVNFSPKPAKSARKSKPVKKAQVGSNILFKVNKKKLLSPSEKHRDKTFDVYDFEDTQDVFAKPDFKAFRNTKAGDSEPDSLVTSSARKENNITKKKCMIMGRIFKNAAKSKVEDIDEEIRSIPSMAEGELVESYVASCSKEAFARQTKLAEGESKRRKQKVARGKKRTRGDSESTDDEFGLSVAKRRKKEDNCINLEQELRECIGVASRKSQRSCTSGKQNVLVEHWSSDESVAEERPPQRRKRAAAHPLYHWSSSSEDEGAGVAEGEAAAAAAAEEERPVQHGWIVGESPKKLVMMLAQAKGKKSDADGVKEMGKKRASAGS